jgi:hypothetical protein
MDFLRGISYDFHQKKYIFWKLALITDKEPCKFAVNEQQNNYSFLHVTSKVSCIRRKRGQIICLQLDRRKNIKSWIKYLKEALATIFTKKSICFGNW